MIAYRIWQIAGWTMLHYLWVGAVLGVAAIVLRLFLRSAAANVRYVATLGSLLLMADRTGRHRGNRHARIGTLDEGCCGAACSGRLRGDGH